MNLVFDTNVLISSTLWDGSVSQKLLFKLINLDVNIFSSNEIIAEYKKVLKRDFGYLDEEIVSIVERIFLFVKLVEPVDKLNIIKEDPSDNKIIECALASNSKYILTYDKKHLLKLKEYNGIKIISPEEMLRIINTLD